VAHVARLEHQQCFAQISAEATGLHQRGALECKQHTCKRVCMSRHSHGWRHRQDISSDTHARISQTPRLCDRSCPQDNGRGDLQESPQSNLLEAAAILSAAALGSSFPLTSRLYTFMSRGLEHAPCRQFTHVRVRMYDSFSLSAGGSPVCLRTNALRQNGQAQQERE